jgi:hypothetical protein
MPAMPTQPTLPFQDNLAPPPAPDPAPMPVPPPATAGEAAVAPGGGGADPVAADAGAEPVPEQA